MLRDRLVLGCRSSEARRKLLTMDPLTLKVVQDTLSMFEAVECANNDMSRIPADDHVHHTKHKPYSSRKEERRSQPHRYPKLKKQCSRCGRSDFDGNKNSCPAFGKNCAGCGKMNHFKIAYHLKRIHSMKDNEIVADDPLLYVDAFPTNVMSTKMVLQINKHPIDMEVDTGAAVTLISESIWRSMGSPKLTPSNKLFTAYDGHKMKPVGDLKCCIEAKGKSVLAVVTVVNSFKTYGLLGRDLMETFITPKECVDNIDDQSPDGHLPCMKAKPVSVDVCDRNRLQFCKAHPVPIPMRKSVESELLRLQSAIIGNHFSSTK